MGMTVQDAQKRIAEIQKANMQFEYEKSKAQEEVMRITLEQQKLTTEVNEILLEVEKTKNSGLTLPTDFKANPNTSN